MATCKQCVHVAVCEEFMGRIGLQDFEATATGVENRCKHYRAREEEDAMTPQEAFEFAQRELGKVRRSMHQAQQRKGDNQQEIEGLQRKEAFWLHVMNTFEREMEDGK